MPRCCPNVNLHINDYSLWCSNLQLCIEREQTTERSMRGPEICRIAITFHSDAFMSVTLQSKSSVEWRKRNEKDFSSGERRSGFCAADDDGLFSLSPLLVIGKLNWNSIFMSLTKREIVDSASQELYELFNQKLIFLNESRVASPLTKSWIRSVKRVAESSAEMDFKSSFHLKWKLSRN